MPLNRKPTLETSSKLSLVKTFLQALPLFLALGLGLISPNLQAQEENITSLAKDEPSTFVKESNKKAGNPTDSESKPSSSPSTSPNTNPSINKVGLDEQKKLESIKSPTLKSPDGSKADSGVTDSGISDSGVINSGVVDLNKQNEIAQSLAQESSYLLDPNHFLTHSQSQALKKKLYYFAQGHDAEIAIVLIPSAYGRDMFSLSTEIFDKLKPGVKGLDSGLLLVLALKDKKYQIVTGSGVEGIIPDALTDKVANQHLIPNLRNNDLYQALDSTITAFMSLMTEEYHRDTPRWKDRNFNLADAKALHQELQDNLANENDRGFGDILGDIMNVIFIIVWGLVFFGIMFGRFFFRRLRPFIPLRFRNWTSRRYYDDDDDDDFFRGGRGGGGGSSSSSRSSSRSWSAGGGRGFGGGRTSGGGSGGSW